MGYAFGIMPVIEETPRPELPADVREALEDVIRRASAILAQYPEPDDDLSG